jgi:hypothetical protein
MRKWVSLNPLQGLGYQLRLLLMRLDQACEELCFFIAIKDPWHILSGYDLEFAGMSTRERVRVMLEWFGRRQTIALPINSVVGCLIATILLMILSENNVRTPWLAARLEAANKQLGTRICAVARLHRFCVCAERLGRRRELDAKFPLTAARRWQSEGFPGLPFACVRAAIYVQDFTCRECGVS